MTNLEIYQSLTNDPPSFSLYYTPDNMLSFEITKESNVFPFSLPFVDEYNSYYVNTDISEKIDLVTISGISATLALSFWIPVTAIPTMLGLISNKMDVLHMIQVNEWVTNGSLTNYKFYGRVSSVRMTQDGGTPMRLQCNMSFAIGNVLI